MSKPYFGGQAVIEGVMMQGPEGKAIAVRQPDGTINKKVVNRKALKQKYPILGIPIIRGFVSFCESMLAGLQDITWSAAQAGESEEDKLTMKDIILAVAAALVLVVLLFIAFPVFVASFTLPYVGAFGRSLIEGLIRGAIFVAYVYFVGKIPEMSRLFAYHGAEHKTISTYEAGEELTVVNARKYSTIHPRCGTSFILMSMMLMIIVFTFVGQTTVINRILIKIACMPFIAGIAYELFRLPLYFPHNIFVKALVAPGLWMQHLTTREPDDEQLEVAIAAITATPGFLQANQQEENIITTQDSNNAATAQEDQPLIQQPVQEQTAVSGED